MALHWNWSEKCGEATLVQPPLRDGDDDRVFTLNLYNGNALLIMIDESENTWSMYSFWADKSHMKNCLGLDKKTDPESYNMYEQPDNRITKVRLNKKKCRYLSDIVGALTKAFDNITIELYTEEDTNE